MNGVANGGQRRRRLGLALWGITVFAVAWFSGRKVAGPPMPTRIYDLRDLLTQTPDFDNAPYLGIRPQNGPKPGAAPPIPAVSVVTVESLRSGRTPTIDEIVKSIRSNIEPQSWARGSGVISELGGSLVITQTPAAHEQIQRLLRNLAASKRIQIAVEARFVWLDDEATATMPVELRNRIASGLKPGASANANELSSPEVNLILNASQTSQATLTLTCPRITLFNGQRAYFLTANQRAYVSGIDESHSAAGATTRTSRIDVVDSGILLDVQGTIAADRKTVTLSLRPEMSELLALKSAGPSSAPSMAGAAVQLPVLDYTTLRTTVTIEQGKIYLISGFTQPPPSPKGAWATTKPSSAGKALYLLIKPTIIVPALDPNAGVFPHP